MTSITFLPDNEVLLSYRHGRYVDTVEDGQFRRSAYNWCDLKVGIFKENWLYEES